MNVAKITEVPAKRFFGLEPSQNLVEMGLDNLMKLMTAMQEKLGIVHLGTVEDSNFSFLFPNNSYGKAKLAEFKEKGLAVITLQSPEFAHPSTQGFRTHTIGLAIQKFSGKSFYCASESIVILDSLGDKYPGAQKIHGALLRYIQPLFPHSDKIITKVPQQIDGSVSCLNWTLANLQTVRNYPGRIDILSLLPKSSDLPKILQEQQQLVQSLR